MRYSEFKLVEASGLAAGELLKYGANSARVNKFLEKIKTSSPFTIVGTEDTVTIDPNEHDRVKDAIDNIELKGTFPLQTTDGGTIGIGKLAKTGELGGQHPDANPDGPGEAIGKEGFSVKPSDIFADERFPAKQVFNEVINNPKLQEQEIGQIIIEMAKEIQDGNDAQFKNIQTEFKSAIRDYAGEYLGVLALIRGTANFPTRKEWLQHLGVSSIDSIFINFPSQSNFALGDSIGSFENAETGNMILISSKGGKMGAPPSLNSLKVPDNLIQSDRYRNEVDFVETMQGGTSTNQPFLGINKLFELAPESINETIRNILPLSNSDMEEIIGFMDKNQYTKEDWNQMPEKYHPLFSLVSKTWNLFKDTATPGGIIHYILGKDIINAVNERNAFPEFESMAREILQKNFIQIFARPKGAVLGFDVLWPNVELATGKVKLYSKASASDPKKAKMSFSVTD